VAVTACEWLWMQEPDFCINRISKLIPRWYRHVIVLRDNA